jgi:uncharacterized protein YuzE
MDDEAAAPSSDVDAAEPQRHGGMVAKAVNFVEDEIGIDIDRDGDVGVVGAASRPAATEAAGVSDSEADAAGPKRHGGMVAKAVSFVEDEVGIDIDRDGDVGVVGAASRPAATEAAGVSGIDVDAVARTIQRLWRHVRMSMRIRQKLAEELAEAQSHIERHLAAQWGGNWTQKLESTKAAHDAAARAEAAERRKKQREKAELEEHKVHARPRCPAFRAPQLWFAACAFVTECLPLMDVA